MDQKPHRNRKPLHSFPRDTSASLGAKACKQVLVNENLNPQDIDLIICATATAEYQGFPSNACLIKRTWCKMRHVLTCRQRVRAFICNRYGSSPHGKARPALCPCLRHRGFKQNNRLARPFYLRTIRRRGRGSPRQKTPLIIQRGA